MREDEQPADAQQDEHDGEHPLGGEGLVEDRGAAIELRPARQQRREHDGEQDRLLVVESLQQRRDHAHGQQDDGDRPGRVEAELEPAREEEQPGARDAPDEVRCLDHAEREHAFQQPEAPLGGGRGPGSEQHDPGKEARGREHLRSRQPAAEPRRHARQVLAPPAHLARSQEPGRDQQRDDVVDDPVGEQGGEQRRARRGAREELQQHHLEDPESGRDVARDPGDLGHQEHADEVAVRRPVRRQQHVQHPGREQPVGAREPDLRQRDPEGRYPDPPPPPGDRRGQEQRGEQIPAPEREAERTEGATDGEMRRQHAREAGGRGEQRHAEQHQQPEPERRRVQRRHPRDVARRQPPAHVEMHPHRGPADERRPHVVRDDVAHERGERRAPIGKRLADEARGEGVVAGEYEVVERRERHRGGDAGRRQRAQRRDHL